MATMAEMIKTTINGKWDILLPKHRADRKEWPTWEYKRLESMHNVITTKYAHDPVVYYIGAEEGDMAALLAMWGAKLVLFEPNEKVWSNIKAIWRFNKLEEPLLCLPAFASDKSQLANSNVGMRGFPPVADGPLLGDHGFRELLDPGEIPQIRIDDIHKPIPDMISIDVEGSEGKVLRGAEQTLRKYHPRIYLSLHPEFLRNYNEWGAELRKWIKELGYKETLLDYPLHEVHLLYEADIS